MDVVTDTSSGSKSVNPLPFDVDVQTATITDVLSKAVGAEVVWNIDEPFTPDEVSEAIQVLQKSSKLDGEALRTLDSVYISVIVEFLLQNTSHQARFSFMTNLVEYFAKNNTPFELNAIVSELLSKPSLDDEVFWNFLCDFLEKYLDKFNMNTHLEIIKRILECIERQPSVLTASQFASISRGIRIIELLAPHNGNYLPQYLIMTECIASLRNPHWTLTPLFTSLMLQRSCLAALTNILDVEQLCRMVGPSKEEESSFRKKSPKKHQIFMDEVQRPPVGNTSLWNRHVQTLLHMLCEGVPLHLVKNQVQIASESSPTIIASETLNSACILRALQLVNNSVTEVKGEIKIDAWWDEWQHFADQFYTFVEIGLLDYEQFVITLGRQRTQRGDKVKDNAVIWLLTQCLPIDQVKQLFKDDLVPDRKNGGAFGFLMPIISGFYNRLQGSDLRIYHDLRDSAFTCLIFRMFTIIGAEASPEVRKYIQTISERTQTMKVLNQYRNWYIDSQKNGEAIDYYNLPPKPASVLYVLSTFMSQPIATGIFDFLQRQEMDTSIQCVLTGDIPFKGKVKPISVVILAHYSIRCRQRVLEHIETTLFQEKAVEAKSPGLLETYVRLLYIAPGSKNKYRLQNNLRTAEPPRLNTLLEILNFRLMRYFKFHDSTKELLKDLFECLSIKLNSHQLWKSLENFFIKICLNLRQIIKFGRQTETLDFGETLNRILVLSYAKILKTKGITDYAQTQELTQLLQRLFSVSPHIWTPKTRAYFPDVMKKFYDSVSYPQQVATRERVINDFKLHEPNFEFLERSGDMFIKRYKQDPFSAPLFLPVYWLVTLEHKKFEGMANAYRIVQSFGPKDLVYYTYVFIDFLLDESPLQVRPLSMDSRANYLPEVATPDKVALNGQLLSAWIWVHKIIDFETVVLALMDRDDDPNAFGLLEYLFLTDDAFATRANYFVNLSIQKDHWREENYWIRHRDFDLKFPEYFKGSPRLPSYYSNVCVRMLSIFDFLLGRLIEHDKLAFAGALIHKYFGLFRHKEYPTEFVVEFLIYYHESTALQQNPEFRLKFLQLIDIQTISFTDQFLKYYNTKDISAFNENYFFALINRLANVITTYPSPNIQNIKPGPSLYHLFQEFPTISQRMITSSLLEVLMLPLSVQEIGRYLVELAFQQKLKPFSFLNSICVILTLLPPTFHTHLLQKAASLLKSDKILTGASLGSLPLDAVFNFANDYTSNQVAFINSDANKMLTMLQLFFHYSSADKIEIFPHLVNATRPLQGIQQLYFLCKVVAPFMYRLSSNGELVAQILLSVLECFVDLDKKIGDLFEQFKSSINSGPVGIIEVMIDWVYHCKYAFPKLSTEFFDKAKELTQKMCPELRRRFKHL